MKFEFKERYNIDDLVEIVKILRSQDGCPWDKVQTHQSIRQDFIEEVYEAVEAIDDNDAEHLREELGDVLLQVVFHCVLETEQQHFTFEDAADDVCKKLILRHPHVFGDVNAETTEEVLKNWDAIKMQSKSQQYASEAMESVSKTLPSLMRSEKLHKKAERGGLKPLPAKEQFSYVCEKLKSLEESFDNNDECLYERRVGELLFAVAGLSYQLGTDCEQSLYRACDSFIEQFKKLELLAEEKGINIQTSESDIVRDLMNEAASN